jgi:hypothetical protein
MQNKYKLPEWASEGPEDLEYRTYKMLSHVKSLKSDLLDQKLLSVLVEVDSTLDYLYRYDALKMTEEDTKITAGDWGPLSFVFSTEEDSVEQSLLMDTLVDSAIDRFEELHSICRDIWREIENNLKASYISDKKYFLADGFVFLKTKDNKLLIYYFNKPVKNFTTSWKDFKLQHIKTQEWNQDDYFESLEEIVEKKSDKILIKSEISIDVNIDGHAMAVINSFIFSMLRRDYSF